jgi:hypothetical protein
VPRPGATLSILQVAQIGTKALAWFHAFAQNANNFKDSAPPAAASNWAAMALARAINPRSKRPGFTW